MQRYASEFTGMSRKCCRIQECVKNVQFSSEMDVRGQICSRTRGVQVHLMKKEKVILYVLVSTGGDCETNVNFMAVPRKTASIPDQH